MEKSGVICDQVICA